MVDDIDVSGANYFGNAIFEISLMDDANNILYVTWDLLLQTISLIRSNPTHVNK